MNTRSLTKDFYRLQKNINSFTNNEATIVDFDDDLTFFQVELNIKDGFYKDGLFRFEVLLENYPHGAPTVNFLSQIFHPNIGDGFDHGHICFDLLDEWTARNSDLEDLVHGMLFLVKNPNFEDPLNPQFNSDDYWSDDDFMINFQTNVKQSLEGGEIEGIVFTRNPGIGPEVADEESKKDDLQEIIVKEKSSDNALVVEEIPALPDVVPIVEISVEVFRDVCRPYFIFGNHGLPLKFDERRTFHEKVEPHINWLVHLFTALRKKNSSKEVVKACHNSLWKFKPMNYLQRALTWNKR